MQRAIDLTLAVLGSIVGFGLSWPFWRDFSYWPESHLAWYLYFVIGFVLAVYVFYAFIGSLRTLFEHDALLREESTRAGDTCQREGDAS